MSHNFLQKLTLYLQMVREHFRSKVGRDFWVEGRTLAEFGFIVQVGEWWWL